MTDQQEQPPPRRFFQYFEQSVRGIAVHLLRAINDDDAPPLLRCGQPEKTGNFTRVLDKDLTAQAAAPRIIGSLDRQQVRMTPGSNPAKDTAFGIYREATARRTAEHVSPKIRRLREQEPGEPEGERCLANPARPAQQDRVRQTTQFVKASQLALDGLVTDKLRISPRCGGTHILVGRRFYAARHPQPRTGRIMPSFATPAKAGVHLGDGSRPSPGRQRAVNGVPSPIVAQRPRQLRGAPPPDRPTRQSA